MNLTEIVQSNGYKAVMAKVYGWGAAIVIIGAMFKIMHWPGASAMLIAGLSTEAVIFFLSAFEPPHEQPDWSLVYPELGGLSEEDEKAVIDDPKLASKKSALEKFDAMIENAEITPALFEKLGHGLKNLNQTTEKLADVSDATVATNNYVANFEKASLKVNQFADAYGQSAQSLNQSANTLSESYSKTSELVSDSAKKLADSYASLTSSINKEINSSTEGNKSYGEQLVVMTKNLTALNSVYELQLQSSSAHIEASKQLYTGLDDMMKSLKDSATDAKVYREEIAKLSNNLSALNTVYGNMLTAMNVKL